MAEASAAPVVDFHLAPLPDGWISLKDEASGEYYFVNENANPPEITWNDPRERLTLERPKPAAADANPSAGQPMQSQGAPVPVLPATGATSATCYAPPPKLAPKQPESELQDNGLPKGWLAILDPPSGRFFFVNENLNPPLVTWDDPRTPEIETAPEAPKPVYLPPPKAAPTPTSAPAPVPAPVPVAAAPAPVPMSAGAQPPAPQAFAAVPVQATPPPQAFAGAQPSQVVYTNYAAPTTAVPVAQPTYVAVPIQQVQQQPPQSQGPSVGKVLVGGALLGAAMRRPGPALMVGAMAGSRRRRW